MHEISNDYGQHPDDLLARYEQQQTEIQDILDQLRDILNAGLTNKPA